MSRPLFRMMITVAICLTCTGCWDSTEIDRLAIVTVSGADLVKGNDNQENVLATFQIARPSELGTSGGGAPTTPTGSTKAFILEQGEGSNNLAAVESIRKRLSRKLFMGHRRAVIIGEEYARRGVSGLMDEMVRNPQSRLRTFIVVAYQDTASDIMTLPYSLNRLPADAIVEIEQQGRVVSVDAKQFVQRLTGHGDGFLPGIQKVNSLHAISGKSNETFALNRIAVFKSDKLVGWMSGEEMQGFLWIYGKIRSTDVTVAVPNTPGGVTARLLHLRTRPVVRVQNGKPQAIFNTRVELEIVENDSGLDLNVPSNMVRVRQLVQLRITNQTKLAMGILQHQYGADCFGIGDKIDKRYPRYWESMERNWTEIYSQMPVQFNVNVRIRGSGLIGPQLKSTSS